MKSEKKTKKKPSHTQKRVLLSVLLTSATSLRPQTHTRTCMGRVRDSEGTSWFGVRPGMRAHKAMGTAGHRREDVRRSAAMPRAEG